MPLTDIEVDVVKTCCELNDNLILSVREHDKMIVFKSRFLSVDFDNGFIIIDEPSPEDSDSRKFKNTQINVWGLQFLGKERNKNINYYRNKIMRFVVERQREILTK